MHVSPRSFFSSPMSIISGDVEKDLANSDVVVEGEFKVCSGCSCLRWTNERCPKSGIEICWVKPTLSVEGIFCIRA